MYIEKSSQEKKTSYEKMNLSAVIRRKKGGKPMGYSGRTTLRRDECDMQTHC
jgi:hypothetical protein